MFDLQRFRDKFRELYNSEPRIFSAPGRVNLIGEHTDYNEGFVLPFAIDRRTYVAAAPRRDKRIKVWTQTLERGAEFELNEDFSADEKDWTIYVKGICQVLRQKELNLSGANLLIDSEIPFGAGLSSSAALEISLGMALTSVSNLKIALTELAFIGQRVEHEFAGVKSGIMDQFASALAEKNHALLIDCRNLKTRQIRLLLEDSIIAVCDTRIKHQLASSEYNTRRAECEQGVEIFRQNWQFVKSLRDVSFENFQDLETALPENVRKRCRHVITENARTLLAAECLEKGEFNKLGELMLASHASLRDDYEVSCRELDFLVETASEIEEVYGARMTGGGFGGCTVNLLEREKFEEFQSRISANYQKRFGFAPDVYLFEAGGGANEIL